MNIRLVPPTSDVLRATARLLEPDEVRDGRAGDVVLANLAEAMLRLMREANGIGLAAPQVGIGLRMWVADISEGRTPYVVLNPTLSGHKGEAIAPEGCLSLPGVSIPVRRARIVTIDFQEIGGTRKTMRVAGLLARVAQHETDHLDGILITDKSTSEPADQGGP